MWGVKEREKERNILRWGSRQQLQSFKQETGEIRFFRYFNVLFSDYCMRVKEVETGDEMRESDWFFHSFSLPDSEALIAKSSCYRGNRRRRRRGRERRMGRWDWNETKCLLSVRVCLRKKQFLGLCFDCQSNLLVLWRRDEKREREKEGEQVAKGKEREIIAFLCPHIQFSHPHKHRGLMQHRRPSSLYSLYSAQAVILSLCDTNTTHPSSRCDPSNAHFCWCHPQVLLLLTRLFFPSSLLLLPPEKDNNTSSSAKLISSYSDLFSFTEHSGINLWIQFLVLKVNTNHEVKVRTISVHFKQLVSPMAHLLFKLRNFCASREEKWYWKWSKGAVMKKEIRK